jgi:hypothetical protein
MIIINRKRCSPFCKLWLWKLGFWWADIHVHRIICLEMRVSSKLYKTS